MELSRLIEGLSKPDVYPNVVENIEVRQTHISIVFLVDQFAYKVKKPVHFDFLDFTELAARRHFCDEEIRLNRRLAPNVYLERVPIVERGAALKVGGPGTALEWAVKMRRLPDHATWESRLARGEIRQDHVHHLAARIASFHRSAERNDRISQFAQFEAVAGTVRQNLLGPSTGDEEIVHPSVLERLRQLTEKTLADKRKLIDDRANEKRPCDTHGDLHLDHIYAFPDEPPPGDLVIVDCIEFNERFRYTDPVADMAFVVMDLIAHGRRDLAQVFAESYFRESGDHGGSELLSLYVSYRAAVRGKVEGLKALEREIEEEARKEALDRAKSRWLLALSELESPREKPCLILIGGLPGTGKSTLARSLAEQAGFAWIRSDVVRKQLAGLDPLTRGHDEIYTTTWSDRTYAECLRRAIAELSQGHRVIVDAVFGNAQKRRMFRDAAAQLGLPVMFFVCTADLPTVRNRLQKRQGDPSDADLLIYHQAKDNWQSPPLHLFRKIDMNGGLEHGTSRALDILRSTSLW
jgi:aminoglycoside phosphotransferase family enzyme/predicted kinase